MRQFLAQLWWVLQRDYFFTNEDAARERMYHAYSAGIDRGHQLANTLVIDQTRQLHATLQQLTEDLQAAQESERAADAVMLRVLSDAGDNRDEVSNLRIELENLRSDLIDAQMDVCTCGNE